MFGGLVGTGSFLTDFKPPFPCLTRDCLGGVGPSGSALLLLPLPLRNDGIKKSKNEEGFGVGFRKSVGLETGTLLVLSIVGFCRFAGILLFVPNNAGSWSSFLGGAFPRG